MLLARWIDAHGETTQYVLFLGLLALLIALEWWAPFRARPKGRARGWAANYALTALNVLAIGALPISFVGVARLAADQGVGLLNAVPLPLAAVVIATLLLRGFVSFLTHFLMHKIPLLWLVHRVHHLDTELDVSTTVRFHPAEFPVALAVGAPLVFAFGLSPWVLAFYELGDVVVTLWSHANVRTPPAIERVLRYFVVTPELHRVHHSVHVEETDSNFGAVFPIWDLVFGTFRTETREAPATMRMGLEEVRDERTTRVGWLLTVPFHGAFARSSALESQPG